MTGNKTLTIIKPAAVKSGLIGPILSMINSNGFYIAAMKLVHLDQSSARKFYNVHRDRPFFDGLVRLMISGPVVVAILEKENAVNDYRELMGSTDPAGAREGTLRKLFGVNLQSNAVHGSDSDANAEIECNFFFSPEERFSKFDK